MSIFHMQEMLFVMQSTSKDKVWSVNLKTFITDPTHWLFTRNNLLTFSIDLGPRHVRIMSEIACRQNVYSLKTIKTHVNHWLFIMLLRELMLALNTGTYLCGDGIYSNHFVFIRAVPNSGLELFGRIRIQMDGAWEGRTILFFWIHSLTTRCCSLRSINST